MAKDFNRFQGIDSYITSQDLRDSVNASIELARPLLVKGEPGTGKTLLSKAIAEDLGTPFISWHIKSTTKAREGLYTYDTVQRLHDSRFGDHDVSDIRQYIKLGPLGQAFKSDVQVTLLIDEVDKADIEFPNDLLNELDEMSFYIPELDETVKAKHRPIVIVTSNSEKELPDAFLRRCVFHYIEFPSSDMMEEIVKVHHPGLDEKLMEEAIKKFYWLRGLDRLRKKPSTSELIDWIQALVAGGVDAGKTAAEFPFLGSLLKVETDIRSTLSRAGLRR